MGFLVGFKTNKRIVSTRQLVFVELTKVFLFINLSNITLA